MIGMMLKDFAAILGAAVVAQAVEPIVRERLPGSMMELLIYVALACVAGAARTVYDTRSGQAPKLFVLIRGVLVSIFVGAVVASVLGEYDISAGFKAAWVLVASFFSDSTISWLGKFFRAKLASVPGVAPLPKLPKTPASEDKP